MAAGVNRQIILAARPDGNPKQSDFALREAAMPEPGAGQLLVRTLWLSLDPYMRLRIAEGGQYYPAVPLGDVMIGGGLSRVVESNHAGFAAGDYIEAYTGWQDHPVAAADGLRKLDAARAPISTALGVLGMPGLTAYLGLIDVGAPEPGDTVVVSAAAGAVGAVVGQVARIAGCRAVGLAGSARKIAYLRDELGFDAAINYKAKEIGAALDAACPDGINVYFENVGGAVAEAVYPRLAKRARVVICGGVSQYNLKAPQTTVSNLQNILFTEARVGGFNIFSYEARYEDALGRLARWLAEGRLKYKEDVVDGLENAATAFLRFFDGETFGKLLVRVAE
ncbi:MAG: NADP-dependent oxidoreductase [Alphaproteobacteria bacterium]|nr:NADP-dependent oxidoreductase [Alphaproteobacteria bacterium]